MRRSLALSLLAAALPVYCCSKDLDRVRQVRTVADMQTIVAKIEAVRGQEPSALKDSTRIRQLISAVAEGKDAWGHKLIYQTKCAAGGGCSYALISLGSDGKPDLGQEQNYFTLAEQSIHGAPWRDIVFRDGHAITRAGK